MPAKKPIPKRSIRDFAAHHGLTMEDLANRLGVSLDALRYADSHGLPPSRGIKARITPLQIARAVGCPYVVAAIWFMGLVGHGSKMRRQRMRARAQAFVPMAEERRRRERIKRRLASSALDAFRDLWRARGTVLREELVSRGVGSMTEFCRAVGCGRGRLTQAFRLGLRAEDEVARAEFAPPDVRGMMAASAALVTPRQVLTLSVEAAEDALGLERGTLDLRAAALDGEAAQAQVCDGQKSY